MLRKIFLFDRYTSKLMLAFLFSVSLSLLTYYTVLAQDSQPGFPTDDEVNAIAKGLYCPVCPNTPLDVCETQACQDWRAQIKDQLAQGWNEDQIIAYFVQQYGERVLAEPRRTGFTSLVWVLPVTGVFFGLIFVSQILKSWRKEQIAPDKRVAKPTAMAIAPETLARLEKELQEMD